MQKTVFDKTERAFTESYAYIGDVAISNDISEKIDYSQIDLPGDPLKGRYAGLSADDDDLKNAYDTQPPNNSAADIAIISEIAKAIGGVGQKIIEKYASQLALVSDLPTISNLYRGSDPDSEEQKLAKQKLMSDALHIFRQLISEKVITNIKVLYENGKEVKDPVTGKKVYKNGLKSKFESSLSIIYNELDRQLKGTLGGQEALNNSSDEDFPSIMTDLLDIDQEIANISDDVVRGYRYNNIANFPTDEVTNNGSDDPNLIELIEESYQNSYWYISTYIIYQHFAYIQSRD